MDSSSLYGDVRSGPQQQPGRVLFEQIAARNGAGMVQALACAMAGWRVVPAAPGSSHPCVADWPRQATTDPTQIERWFNWDFLQAQACIATGRESGVWVLDIDPQHGGSDTIRQLQAVHGRLPQTFTVCTPSGGWHLYFQYPQGVEVVTRAGTCGPGLDTRGRGGQVLAPGSVRGGGTYRPYWVGPTPLAQAPNWLLSMVLRPERPSWGDNGVGGNGAGQTSEVDESRPEVVDWLLSAPTVAAGSQEDYLFRGLCSLRTMGAAQPQMQRLGWMVAGRFWASRPDQPWTEQDVADKVDSICRRYPPGATVQPVSQVQQDWAARVSAANGAAAAANGALPSQPESMPPALSNGSGGGEAPSGGESGPESPAGAGTSGVGTDEPWPESLTDMGNGSRMARVLQDRVRYCRGSGWLVWTGTHWRPDDRDSTSTRMLARRVTADVQRQADSARAAMDNEDGTTARAVAELSDWADKLQSRQRFDAMLAMARDEPRIAIDPEQIDLDPNRLACPNGTLDLRTGLLGPNDPADLIARAARVEYKPEAAAPGYSPLLEEFLDTFVPAQDREYLFRVLGSTLVGGNQSRRLVILHGGTTSGKSTLMDLVARAIGEYSGVGTASVLRGNLDDRPRPDLLKANGYRLLRIDEASDHWDLHADQVKRITGGDTITARGLYENPVTRGPAFTPVVVCNQTPRIKGADAAIRRRVLALVMDQTLDPAVEDPNKKVELLADTRAAEATLARLVAGCLRYAEKGLENERPESSLVGTARAFDQLDNVHDFVESLVESGELVQYDGPKTEAVTAGELHARYRAWTNLHGSDEDRRAAPGLKAFGDRLAMRGWVRAKSRGTVRWVGWRLGSGGSDKWHGD